MKTILSTVVLFALFVNAAAQIQYLDKRKYFQYVDTSFEVGTVKILRHIYYGFSGGSPIRPESFPHLDSVVSFLYYHPALRVEVGSHTDNKGNDKYNLKLAQHRARQIVDYLLNKGISSDRLTAKGYGETLPIALNETDGKDNPEGRQRNRRAELKIISIDPVKGNFSPPTLLNPQLSFIHFLFGENSSALTLSLFHVRDIESILDSCNESDSSFRAQYKSFARNYIGFTDAAGDRLVMAVINFSAPHRNQRNFLFDSNTFSKTRTLFINLSKKICLTPGN